MKLTAQKTFLRYGVTILTLLFAVSAFLATTAFAQTETLTISDVEIVDIDAGKKSATVVWKTNLLSQSIVVCGNSTQGPFTFDVEKANFGYTWSTIILGGVTLDHRVPLAQLAPETHYCRVASRLNESTPWVVSDEVTFTTGGEVTVPVATPTEEGTWDDDMNRGKEVEDDAEEATGPGAFSRGMCSDSWSVWALVLIALLIATLWSKEVMEKMTNSDSPRRLYVLGGAGLIVFLIALLNGAGNWVVPIGIGTMAIIAATIVDVVRKEDATPHERLAKTITTLLVATLIAFILAIVLNWTCAVTPVAGIAIVLGIRHYMFNKEEKEEDVETRIMKVEEKDEDGDEEEEEK